jgi:hypothetical protein
MQKAVLIARWWPVIGVGPDPTLNADEKSPNEVTPAPLMQF